MIGHRPATQACYLEIGGQAAQAELLMSWRCDIVSILDELAGGPDSA